MMRRTAKPVEFAASRGRAAAMLVGAARRRAPPSDSTRRMARRSGGIRRGALLVKLHRLARSPSGSSAGSALRFQYPPIGADEMRLLRLARELADWIGNSEPYVDEPGADADIPPGQRRAFLELGERSCRWPVGDPASAEFFFCGGETVAGRPYCAGHCARAYLSPLSDRRSPARRERPRRRNVERRFGRVADCVIPAQCGGEMR
jgi:GcrA cell cycle regulator